METPHREPSSPQLPASVPAAGHKGDAGRVLLVAGSTAMPGAALLAARAAQRGGAGLVTVAHLWPGTLPIVAGGAPEALHLDLASARDLQAGRLPRALAEARRDARVIGPGLSRTGRTRELVRRSLEAEDPSPLVLDADGLAVLGGAPEVLAGASAPVVLTPHPGEAAALLERELGSSEDARLAAARELAEAARAVVVLKGQHTLVVEPGGGRTHRSNCGNPGMATGGSGDVLAGLLGAYLARAARIAAENGQALDPFLTTVAAVEVHGRAGDRAAEVTGRRALIASDLLDHLGPIQRELDGA
jgi:NAD(P)H-hydrate epimerase